MIALGVFALVIVLGEWGQAQAQDPKAPYASIAPLDQYLMVDRDAEIAMARSAAREAISRDADALVLGRHGYEPQSKERTASYLSWNAPGCCPTTIRSSGTLRCDCPLCLNPPAARSDLPLTFNQTELAFSGMSTTQMADGTERLHTRMFTDVRSQRAFSHDHVKKIVEIFRLGSRRVSQAVHTGRNKDG
jgi:hypothetical protein